MGFTVRYELYLGCVTLKTLDVFHPSWDRAACCTSDFLVKSRRAAFLRDCAGLVKVRLPEWFVNGKCVARG